MCRLTKTRKENSQFTNSAQYRIVRYLLTSNTAMRRAPAGLQTAGALFNVDGKPVRVPRSKNTHATFKARVACATFDTLVERLHSARCSAIFLEADSSDQPRMKIQALLLHGIEWERVDPNGKPAIGDTPTVFTVCLPLQQVINTVI